MHKSGADSTLYNVAMNGFLLSSRIFIWTSPVFSLWWNDHLQLWYIICFHQWSQYKIRNLWSRVTSGTWVLNSIGRLLSVSKISSRTFCIGRHTCHRRVHLMQLAFVYTVFQCLIYFLLSVRTSFRILCVQVNFLIQSFWFQNSCNEVILWSTSEACTWFPTITFITIIVRVPWIKGWFLIELFLSLLIKEFLSWVWTSVGPAEVLEKLQV